MFANLKPDHLKTDSRYSDRENVRRAWERAVAQHVNVGFIRERGNQARRAIAVSDGVVGRVLGDRAAGVFGDRLILTTGANENVLDPIVRGLQRRDVLGALLDGDGIRLLNAPEHLQVTFDAARLRGEFRASELAADLGIGLPACNNRLKPLLAAGLVIREPGIARSGGCEFVYRIAIGLRAGEMGVARRPIASIGTNLVSGHLFDRPGRADLQLATSAVITMPLRGESSLPKYGIYLSNRRQTK